MTGVVGVYLSGLEVQTGVILGAALCLLVLAIESTRYLLAKTRNLG